MMKYLKICIVLFLLPLALQAQNINGRFSASLYSFERFDSKNESTTYVRNFESLQLNVNQDQFSLRTRLNFESNLSNSLDNDPRLRVYNLFLEARNLMNFATIKIGRQPLFNSVAGGVYDGGEVKLKYSHSYLKIFYGGNVPAYQKLEITNDWKNDFVLGGKLVYNEITNMNIGLAYINKNFKPESYVATRLDSAFRPIEVLIEKNSSQFEYASADVAYNLPKYFDAYSKMDYDLNFAKVSKVEFFGKYKQIKNLGISIYYNYRAPKINYNSIFSVFNYGNTQEIEGGLDYKFSKMLTVFGKFANVEFEDENSQRFTIGTTTEYGTISYRKNMGYAGELDAISVYTARSFMDGFITPSIGFAYTGYKLSEDAEKENITSVLAGVNVRPWKSWAFDLQGQFSDNPIYKNDVRVLFKINHWFNTNLNLL